MLAVITTFEGKELQFSIYLKDSQVQIHAYVINNIIEDLFVPKVSLTSYSLVGLNLHTL